MCHNASNFESSLLESIFLSLVEQVSFRAAKVNNLRTPITLQEGERTYD